MAFWHPSGMHSLLYWVPVVSFAKPRCGHARPLKRAPGHGQLRAIACGDAICALPRSVNHRLSKFWQASGLRSREILQGLTLRQAAHAWEVTRVIRGLTQGQALRAA
jgi:hypothetical protein